MTLCEEHEECYVIYNGLRCPFCQTEKQIVELEKQIVELEIQVGGLEDDVITLEREIKEGDSL